MAARREDRGHRGERPRPGRDDPPSSSRRGGETLNEFFVDGKGIHREVLQREICKYLGPEAYSRPSKYNGVPGYTITAVRPFTPKMLDDLQELSRSYQQENREAMNQGYNDIPYERSKTYRQAQSDEPYDQGSYPSQNPYIMPGGQPGYPMSSRGEYPPPQAAYAGPMYPQGPGYGPGSSYTQNPAYGNVPRPSTHDPYSSYNDPYEEPPRPSFPAQRPREMPRGELREREMRPEQPMERRPDLRSAYPVPDSRMQPRDTRMDPGVMPNYSYAGSSQADIPMRGYNDDYVNASVQMGRGGGSYAPASRVVQPGYETRESPTLRDTYRNEPIREERRPRR